MDNCGRSISYRTGYKKLNVFVRHIRFVWCWVQTLLIWGGMKNSCLTFLIHFSQESVSIKLTPFSCYSVYLYGDLYKTVLFLLGLHEVKNVSF